MGWVAAGVAVAGVAGSAIQANAAQSAAQTQANAAEQASQVQQQQYAVTRNDLLPYNQQGQKATTELNAELPSLIAPFQPTQAQLAATPGYQFTLQQGEQATQNSFAAQGLADSGAALKGAANYAEGLAGTTFQQQFQNYLGQHQQIYSMLNAQQTLGENAAAQTGQAGTAAAQSSGAALIGAGNAGAAGTVGSANAISGGLNSLGSNALTYTLVNNNGLLGGTASGSPAAQAQVNALLPGATDSVSDGVGTVLYGSS
jgi:hypothetical protein